MNILLFGAKEHGTEVAKVLKKNGHSVHIVYLLEESHEEIYYEHLRDYAEAQSIKAVSHKEANKDLLLSIIENEKIDAVLCIKWRYMISETIIAKTRFGGFVIHDSLLPKYRGFAPLNWAIINNEPVVGATLIQMAKEVDAGAIIAQKQFSLGENDTVKSVEKKMVTVYKDIIAESILDITDPSKFVTQDETEATFCCMRRPEDGRIDWCQPALQIHNQVRALAPPFPCAFALYNDARIEITKTKVLSTDDSYVGRIPGRIIALSNEGPQVLTGQGILLIQEIRFQKKLMKATEFFKTIRKKLE